MSTAATKKLVRHYVDLMFTVVAEPLETMMMFTIYKITHVNSTGTYQYVSKEGTPPICELLQDAEVFLHGRIDKHGAHGWWNSDKPDNFKAMVSGSNEFSMRLMQTITQCTYWVKELNPTWEIDLPVPGLLFRMYFSEEEIKAEFINGDKYNEPEWIETIGGVPIVRTVGNEPTMDIEGIVNYRQLSMFMQLFERERKKKNG